MFHNKIPFKCVIKEWILLCRLNLISIFGKPLHNNAGPQSFFSSINPISRFTEGYMGMFFAQVCPAAFLTKMKHCVHQLCHLTFQFRPSNLSKTVKVTSSQHFCGKDIVGHAFWLQCHSKSPCKADFNGCYLWSQNGLSHLFSERDVQNVVTSTFWRWPIRAWASESLHNPLELWH